MFKEIIAEQLKRTEPQALEPEVVFAREGFGDYTTNAALVWGKMRRENPLELGARLRDSLEKSPELKSIFAKIELASPGFINFYFSDDFLRKQLGAISRDQKFGRNDRMKNQKVVVEFTDPNPFKLFHIGHLMSNAVGEAISRLYEASGAKVIRVNYQGDVGLHVAKALLGWKILKTHDKEVAESASLSEKMEFLGNCYALGSGHGFASSNLEFLNSLIEERNKKVEEGALEKLNKEIYEKSNPETNILYAKGLKWSLQYFKQVYRKLGTKFDHYFFESETASDGLEVIQKNKNVFMESEGALIFKGEDHGLHNRVFISKQGLPTYETKELGLNQKKFKKYDPDLSIIVTGNEINDYFRVLLKVMELTMPEVAKKTRHLGHGMMRLPTGKMSSRTGEVVTADSLLEKVTESIKEKEKKAIPKSDWEYTQMAVAAVKFSILKQSIGHDIVFDFEKALSVKGDAAPYLQYTYARLRNIWRKSGWLNRWGTRSAKTTSLREREEVAVIRQLLKFPEIVEESAQQNTTNDLALYLLDLATQANRFYEKIQILGETNKAARQARLILTETVAKTLKRGLNLLGIETLERI